MNIQIEGTTLDLHQGDITLQDVDAVVNAANSRLAGGGGVDGAIHRRGGPAIMKETSRLYPDGCTTGSAVVSRAGNLKAKFVIHAVGPVWRGGNEGEADLLAGAYRRCFELAVENDCTGIALPALSTGAYGYPMKEAADVAMGEAIKFLKQNRRPALVRFVLFDDRAYQVFAKVLGELT